jgi:hypothetical protein
MRTSLIGSLLLLSLLGLGLRDQISDSTPRAVAGETEKRSSKRQSVPAGNWEADVAGGWQSSKEKAFDDALDTAAEKIASHLQVKFPKTELRVERESVRKLVKEERYEDKQLDSDPNVTMYRCSVKVELPDGEARRFLTRHRVFFLGRGLAGILLVLGAVAAYVRLDDWTKGFLTLPLRIIAVMLAGAGIFMLWWPV